MSEPPSDEVSSLKMKTNSFKLPLKYETLWVFNFVTIRRQWCGKIRGCGTISSGSRRELPWLVYPGSLSKRFCYGPVWDDGNIPNLLQIRQSGSSFKPPWDLRNWNFETYCCTTQRLYHPHELVRREIVQDGTMVLVWNRRGTSGLMFEVSLTSA